MSDDLPGACCICGNAVGIVYARAADSSEIEAICRNCYPDKSPPQIARLIQENAKLRDLLSRAVSYVVWADMEVHDFGGTCTDHARLADEIRQAIGPLPGGE